MRLFVVSPRRAFSGRQFANTIGAFRAVTYAHSLGRYADSKIATVGKPTTYHVIYCIATTMAVGKDI